MADTFKWNPGKGGLHTNRNREKDNHPDFVGKITTPSGEELEIAGWNRTDKNNDGWISLNVQEPRPESDSTDDDVGPEPGSDSRDGRR